MVRPISRIILFTLLATVLFTCGIYLHINRINKERWDFYSGINESIQQKLLRSLDWKNKSIDATPINSDTVCNNQFNNSIFICYFQKRSGSIIFKHKSSSFCSDDDLIKLISTLPREFTSGKDSTYQAIRYIDNTPYYLGYQTKKSNGNEINGEIRINLTPAPLLIDQINEQEMHLSLTVFKTDDTVFFSSSSLPENDINYLLASDPYKPFKILTLKANHEKLIVYRIICNISPGFQLITSSPGMKKRSLSTLFLITSFLFLLLGTLLFPMLFRKDLKRQILEINSVVESISEKDFDKHISEEYPDELGQLTRSINRMSTKLKKVYADLEIRMLRRTSEISMRNAELRKTQREILTQNHELKSAYEALVESREKYEKLIDHLKNEYFFYSKAQNGTLLFVSPSVKDILGYTVTKYRNLFNQIYTDNPINDLARQYAEKIQNGESLPKYIIEIYDANNQSKILEVSEVAVFNDENQLVSVEGLAHDITERQKAEELIKEQEEKYRMLFTYASDFIFMYEINKKGKKVGNFIEANQYTIEKLGYSIDELREKTPTNLIAAEIWDGSENQLAEYIADDSKFERIWESKDGNIIDVEISTHAFKIQDKTVAIAVARDISDRKRAEEEIRYVNEELVNQKENLEALVDNLTQTQEQLVQSEKMAALGQLIAGIAHEINTPLGAIKASIGNLSDSLDNALSELPALLQTQSADNLRLFTHIFTLARQKTPELSSREKRQKKRDLSSFLSANNVENADLLSDLLVYLEIYETDDSLLADLKLLDSLSTVKSARNFISLLKNTNTINIAVEKATKVVFALKKYAHKDSGGQMIPTDILDSIETVLTLYHNQLKQGIEVIKNYDKIPLIRCYQDEISQVWTNLIQNAIQAMHQEGTLTITTHLDKELIWVSFKDTGQGIEPDIIDKIFEPFFTTKKQGEGSGLGLDIVKKIIEKHKWTIEVNSKLGEGANFIIKIPTG